MIPSPTPGAWSTESIGSGTLWLEGYLARHPHWVSSGDLANALCHPADDGSKRLIRRLAQDSALIISGQLGYRHVASATPDELDHFVAWMRSQGREMIARADRIASAAHAAQPQPLLIPIHSHD